MSAIVKRSRCPCVELSPWWEGLPRFLRRVVRVDVHVLRGEIRGPEDTRSRSLVQIDRNRILRLPQVGMGGLLIEFGCPATITADALLAKPDVDAFRIDRRSGVADRRHQPAPVRIAACPRRLDQR